MVAVLETGKIIWFEGCLILEQFNLAPTDYMYDWFTPKHFSYSQATQELS